MTPTPLDGVTIEDEASFRHVALYRSLKQVVRDSSYRFRVLPRTASPRWDRALFLNLTFWSASGDGDVLVAARLPADVVTHVAWHHLAAKQLATAHGALSTDALFLGEAIASAFDLYLVGRLLGRAPRSSFLATQVSAMAESASAAGMSSAGFAALLADVARDPDGAFEDLRALLFDATTALLRCRSVEQASRVLARHDEHRFAALLHHYELSNWVLYARAHAPGGARDRRVRSIDRSLRRADVALDWLVTRWLSESAGPGAPRTPSRPPSRRKDRARTPRPRRP